ncbi:hypothetical protein H5410_007341 [Solanum commersonii]|uniref:Uncharacterized protein n=1 Tax=Solanum commersonii TaxID=4109 RepID=A0A9J6ACT2_SOLCO|nr:hypothetical protein H5410_007341 [Solanum commersonii]
MKQKYVDYLQLEIFSMNIFDILKSVKMDPSWITKARGKVVILAEGEEHPRRKHPDRHMDPRNTFASVAKKDVDDIKTYEKVEKREVIFLLENFDIQRREEPWKIFQSANDYNFSKMIIKHIIQIEDWGISSITERQFSLNKVMVNFTYWDYVQAFNKVLCYNNERHKHSWFIKVFAKIFVNSIPNWFLNRWSYHGPIIKILPEPFLKLYKEWVKISPDLNKLYHQEHICYFQQIEHIFFFIEFSVPWIHKWVLEVDFTEEQITCLYRTYYNNFWDKLMKKDHQIKSI